MTELAKVYTVKGSANQQEELVYDEENLSLNDQITDIFIAIRPILINLIKEDVEIEKKQEEGYE